ncbi:MAG: hypothetical protein US75_C0005G0002 [Candidatus Woesebacteria bacterium GW2011_GWC1_38_13]|uniref:Nudix hydrolase domain-containing protein n=3 Tax=Candidatus Woeseibacteriota TaxID=1752722 RepID=A0A0G0IPD6_9BACT|nr:MAG: hypothetical protein US67_C0002G0003 [Candidatus Woesebacteria bacterium GW2011_GWD1_38_10]KKQ56577.1 MAG: hypothetical protein US75_C0005G0002 [Candidatus Woesebacteria bacterium GW2011_GWC1_38_13]KKQ74947.1 MAG: hypothetical protein US97_C0051G0002 [Microgenomates group bacterium GW2011_GWF1_38_5]
MFKNVVLITAAAIGQIHKGKFMFFLVRSSENSDWEIPKLTVRKAESSVHAVLRMTGEQGGMRARVLDEAARYSSNHQINGKPVTQKTLYYTMLHRADSGESIGFFESQWFEYAKAYKKLTLKREKEVISIANKTLKEWRKRRRGRAKKINIEE